MWIYENKTGLRVTATQEDAVQMVADGSTHSCLWPRGTPDQEATELQRLIKNDYYVRGLEMPDDKSEEVHVIKSQASTAAPSES